MSTSQAKTGNLSRNLLQGAVSVEPQFEILPTTTYLLTSCTTVLGMATPCYARYTLISCNSFTFLFILKTFAQTNTKKIAVEFLVYNRPCGTILNQSLYCGRNL